MRTFEQIPNKEWQTTHHFEAIEGDDKQHIHIWKPAGSKEWVCLDVSHEKKTDGVWALQGRNPHLLLKVEEWVQIIKVIENAQMI